MPTQSEADRDDPLLGAFEVVEEGKRGNFTWKRLQLKPCHPGFDGDLHRGRHRPSEWRVLWVRASLAGCHVWGCRRAAAERLPRPDRVQHPAGKGRWIRREAPLHGPRAATRPSDHGDVSLRIPAVPRGWRRTTRDRKHDHLRADVRDGQPGRLGHRSHHDAHDGSGAHLRDANVPATADRREVAPARHWGAAVTLPLPGIRTSLHITRPHSSVDFGTAGNDRHRHVSSRRAPGRTRRDYDFEATPGLADGPHEFYSVSGAERMSREPSGCATCSRRLYAGARSSASSARPPARTVTRPPRPGASASS
jgi:hypothetical protein